MGRQAAVVAYMLAMAAVIVVDGLKTVNDRLGHAAGDELLALVAHAVGAVLRDGDILARVGGDEFVAVGPSGAASTGLPADAAGAALALNIAAFC
jgi:diguanylate cyclase